MENKIHKELGINSIPEPERKREGRPVFVCNDKLVSFEIYQDFDNTGKSNDAVIVPLKNGEQLDVRSLLPTGVKIYFDYAGGAASYTHYLHKKKKVFLTYQDAKSNGWKYVLTIFHEIGHARRAAEKQQETEGKLALQEDEDDHINLSDEDKKRLKDLTSADELEAWRYSIEQMGRVIDWQTLDPNVVEEINQYIAAKLSSHGITLPSPLLRTDKRTM